MAGEIYLVEVLERLHLLSSEANMKENNRNLYSFLEKSKQNLLVKSDLEQNRSD